MSMLETEWVANGCPTGVVVLCDTCTHPVEYHDDDRRCEAAATSQGVSGQAISACGCERGTS